MQGAARARAWQAFRWRVRRTGQRKYTVAQRQRTTWSTRRLADLAELGAEPPIMARAVAAYTQAEVDRAVERLQRKLGRFGRRPRTAAKLEAMWALYADIRTESGWRLGEREVAQFLSAMRHAGDSSVWSARAAALADEAGGSLDARGTAELARVYAKFGDVARVEQVVDAGTRRFGAGWDETETRAIAYARADLPAVSERVLGTRELATAMCEILHAWARARNVERTWAWLERVANARVGGTREWNAVLHVHGRDTRYRIAQVEEVLRRMETASVARDAATFNIMQHACLVRGLQARWAHWHEHMEVAGFRADAYTYTALAVQLGRAGQWSAALRVARRMREHGIAWTQTTKAAVISVERRRNRTDRVMAHFHKLVAADSMVPAGAFTAVAVTALAEPRRWAPELALLARCLEQGRVTESATVDSLGAQLPGLSPDVRGRPLLRLLRTEDAQTVGAHFVQALQALHAAPPGLVVVPGPTAALLAVGDRRRSVTATLNVVVRHVLRAGAADQAEAILMAAQACGIALDSPQTLVALACWRLRAGARAQAARIMGQVACQDTAAALAAAQLRASVDRGDVDATAVYLHRLQRYSGSFPSVRVFNALLAHAAYTADPFLLDTTWREMDMRRVEPDVSSHDARLRCFSRANDLLRLRRAYTDMLDRGVRPTPDSVGAVVRCCVRHSDIDLALHVMSNAESCEHVQLGTAAYNLLLSRIAPDPARGALLRSIFGAMLQASDARLCAVPPPPVPPVDTVRYADLRSLDRGTHLRSWLRPDAAPGAPAHFRRALMRWMTSPAAFSADPTMFGAGDTGQEQPPAAETAKISLGIDAPAPDGTTFIIILRASGQHGHWDEVLRTWDLLADFNSRVDVLAIHHPRATACRIEPFSRMIGWVALALDSLGRPADAQRFWDQAAHDGILSEAACKAGMYTMMAKLPRRRSAT
ncbi:hypothetical protein GGF46_001701 [Coemansia sp. RSA 552]|nr:hypothetical protein GGF46_001701 [Coemansia sp. RSA 552]